MRLGMAQANADLITTTGPARARLMGERLLHSALRFRPGRPTLGWLGAGFLALMLVALALRLFELDGRTMHYDEAIHVHYAWKLANGGSFIHSRWLETGSTLSPTTRQLRSSNWGASRAM